eukprot:TRINITY_DN22016_c0_g1_i1.p1 TRINITY_DN22016_c0_g1~~TRINITY_DN22016_c0_g1_i1.p1  ORF type:complete len:557 (-),score=100.87 TRINITY_DN22016_c0_g1_i1:251-1921(-)
MSLGNNTRSVSIENDEEDRTSRALVSPPPSPHTSRPLSERSISKGSSVVDRFESENSSDRKIRGVRLGIAAAADDEVSKSISNSKNVFRLYLRQLMSNPYFQIAIGIAIAANAIVLAIETDNAEWPCWPAIDNLFLILFGAELSLRLYVVGVVSFFKDERGSGNMMDFIIVVFGITDSWVLPLLLEEETGGRAGMVRVALKFFRLLRLVRLLRFVKMIKQLNDFAAALYTIIGPFTVVIVILFGSTFFIAIILTEMFAHPEGGITSEALQDHIEDQIISDFRDVSTSFYTLFRVITTDNWIGVAEPIIERNGKLWAIFFMIFIMFLTWVMISILTAVASDNVIAATSDRLQKEAQEKERRHKEFMDFVHTTFEEADEDGNGLVDRNEFDQLLEEMNLAEMLQQLNIDVNKEELSRTWDMLDVSGNGVLTIDEFVDGLAFLGDAGVTTRHIVNVDYNIRKIAHRFSTRAGQLFAKLEKWRNEESALVKQVEEHEEVFKQQTELLSLWRSWVLNKHPDSLPAGLEGATKIQDLHSSAFMTRDAEGRVQLVRAPSSAPR